MIIKLLNDTFSESISLSPEEVVDAVTAELVVEAEYPVKAECIVETDSVGDGGAAVRGTDGKRAFATGVSGLSGKKVAGLGNASTMR